MKLGYHEYPNTMLNLELSQNISRVVANTAWNLLGLVLPLMAAIVAIPVLVSHAGVERFGILSLVWIIVGYFAFLDLGLGRAVTKLVSELDAQSEQTELVSLCMTTTVVAGFMGLLGGLLLIILAFVFPAWLAGFPTDLQSELRSTVLLIGVCIPIVILTAVFKGILEGIQRFKVLNLIRGPAGALLFLMPACAALFTPSLAWSVAMTVAARAIMLFAHYVACRFLLSAETRFFSRKWIKPLFEFGGWFTVSNLVGSVIVYMDRFVLAAILPLSKVAFYTAPFELVSKILTLPIAVTSALFPILGKLRSSDPVAASRLKAIAQRIVFCIMLLLLFLGVIFSRDFLRLWLGEVFADQSTVVMQILLLGFVLNALAQVTYTSLQSLGRTRSVAYLHLIELPLYIMVLWGLTAFYGIEGAAIAWALRSGLDWFCLEVLLRNAESLQKQSKS